MEKLKEFLFENYKNELDNDVQSKFKAWIGRCESTDIDSKRLLFCIGIDTKFKLVDKVLYGNIFNQIDYDTSEKPQIQFLKIIEKNSAENHFFSTIKSEVENDQYCSMIKLLVFVRYYLDEYGRYYKKDELTLIKERLKKGEFISVSIPQKSSEMPRDVSWVTLVSEVDKIIEEANSKNIRAIEHVCNKLGLYWTHIGTEYDPKPEWIKLNYPQDIDQVFYQPLAVNADWRSSGGLFLSYKDHDGFGRTRSQSIDYFQDGIKERVHHRIEKEYVYGATFLGRAINCVKDTTNILESAKKRFNDGK